MIPADLWPKGDRTTWYDDDTRTFHDAFNETQRPYTAEENVDADARAAQAQAETNERRLRAAARDALVANRAFLAIASPTNAQVVAQVRATSRQVNALARLVIGDLTGTD